MIRAVLFAVFAVALMSCNDGPPPKVSPWAGGTMFRLEGSDQTLYLPPGFKATSRFRIARDVPALQQDSSRLLMVQGFLESVDWKKGQSHVFADTTSGGLLIIGEEPRVPITVEVGTMVKQMATASVEEMIASESGWTAELLTSDIQRNQHGGLISIRYRIANRETGLGFGLAAYLFSNSHTSYFVILNGGDDYDLGSYLWSLSA